MKILLCGTAALALAATSPALAQMDHAHMDHAMPMPALKPAPAPTPAPAMPAMDGMQSPPVPVEAAPTPAPMPEGAHQDHDGMADMPGMGHMAMASGPADGSGTSRLPQNEGHHGFHIAPGGGWELMLHGYAALNYTNDTGPRGADKTYVTSHLMLTGLHDLGDSARLQLRAGGSLEPIMRRDGYPSLFTTGEVAFGKPLVDRQHPHDLVIELSARVDYDLSDTAHVFLYGGPVAEPALGPSAFIHRTSAQYNPDPPITHHWFDSTHITFGAVTAGFATDHIQLEASAFRGREPDEHRFDIETPRLDSWSVRATFNPSPAWAIQVSHGFLKSPEELEPAIDEHRTTATVHYANGRGLSAMVGFSDKDKSPGRMLTAFVGEANWDLTRHHTLFGRVENVRNDELFPDPLSPLHDQPFRLTKFQAGYAYRLHFAGPVSLALGGSVSAFAKPSAITPYYGQNPMGFSVFAKMSLGH